MATWVIKGDVKYPCKSEEQLKLFLDAGYVLEDKKVEPVEEVKPKRTVKKK